MAEIVVSAFFTVFFEKLASETFKKIARSKGIDSELKKLKRSLIQIQSLLNDASQKEIADEAVKAWLNGLQHLAYEIDDLLDDLATEVMHRELTVESGASTSKVRKLIPTCCTNFSLSARMKGKLDGIMSKLQEVVEEKNNLGLSVKGKNSKHMNMHRRLQTSLVDASTIVGRESDKEALLQKLLEDEPCDKNFSIMPIVGMGGVGKTTLARILYEEMQGNDHFEIKAWVCVSDEFDILNISQTIFHSVGGGYQEFKDLNMLQVALKEKISNKRFMFVLDDVWSESYADWEILVRPFLAGAPGSKVIMTTRKQSLLTQLGYDQPFQVLVLSQDNALSLFSQHALGENNFDTHPLLKPYGEGIVEKCDGLPLALIALGRLLRSKRDVEEWKDVLNSEIWRLGKRDEIVPALRLSYHELSACLKQLFAYCSLFPKDYKFDKEELILLWMAEGFLHQTTTSKSMERWGLECFEELLSRSFFQHAPNEKSFFVMHDLINDLATFVAGDFFSRLDIQMKEFRKEASEKYRHASLVCEEYMVHGRFKALKGQKTLRTILALSSERNFQRFYISSKIVEDLLNELPLLRVLNLSRLSLKEVPEVIGSLKHLRYLNLSRTTITHLPDNICNLHNLHTLIVFGCDSLDKLPESFPKLKNLRHLDIGNTPLLKKFPVGISELKSLQTLSKIIIEEGNGFKMTDLKDLKDLRGKISIVGLEKMQSAMPAQEVNFTQKKISELEVEWSGVFDGSRKEELEKDVLNALKPDNDKLKKLRIVFYGGMMFPNWVGDPSFVRLAEVSISGCKKCTSLPLLGQLPSLKKLFIGGMDEVKLVGLELLGTCTAFPSLESLIFRDMRGLEEWSTENGADVDAAFPSLQQLGLHGCPKLVKVSLEALPSLRSLEISNCGHEALIRLVLVASSLTRLEITDISGLNDQVWGGVIEHLRVVEEVSITSCNEIRYLWKSETEASKVLVNLRKLVVWECSNLVSLGEKEEDNCGSNLTSFTNLIVYFCKSLEHFSCTNSIESLSISCCDAFTSVSFRKGGGQRLKSVSINECKKFLGEQVGGVKTKVLINSSMRMLEHVDICCWPNLKSIVELSSFIHLAKLTISECPSMESFPDHEFLNLVMLKHLRIQGCHNMNVSFPRGLWPPNLCSLQIGGLKKPMSEWGPQNFPTSLVELYLYGGSSEEDVSNFSRLSHLLPLSLTSLTIDGFRKLVSVSMGLQHLTSLNRLNIYDCPKTIDLPDMLFPSLLRLSIYGCPNLKERTSRRGSYWPLISLLPNIFII